MFYFALPAIKIVLFIERKSKLAIFMAQKRFELRAQRSGVYQSSRENAMKIACCNKNREKNAVKLHFYMDPIEGVVNLKLFIFFHSCRFPWHAGVNNEAAFSEYRRNASISQGIESAIGSNTTPRYNISCCAGRSK